MSNETKVGTQTKLRSVTKKNILFQTHFSRRVFSRGLTSTGPFVPSEELVLSICISLRPILFCRPAPRVPVARRCLRIQIHFRYQLHAGPVWLNYSFLVLPVLQLRLFILAKKIRALPFQLARDVPCRNVRATDQRPCSFRRLLVRPLRACASACRRRARTLKPSTLIG